MLINLPEARLGQAVERRDPRRDAGRPRAAAAGEDRRRADVPARHVRDHRGPLDRQRLSRRGAWARRCASRSATGPSSACSMPGAPASIRRSGATPSSCCRRSAASAFPRAIFKLADTDRFDAVKAQIEGDPRLHAGGQARDAVLRRPVGGAVQVHLLPRHDDLGHLLHRRDHRRDDHDVRERRVAHRTKSARCARWASRAPPSWWRSWARRCCSGWSAAWSVSSARRSCRRSRSRRRISRRSPRSPSLHADAVHRRSPRSRSRWSWASSAASCPRRARRA